MSEPQEQLSEAEATRLWQRAAQLQAEAARRAEAVSADAAEEGSPDTPGEGYALAHVRAAALEAGIGEEFVEAALTDLRAERAVEGPGRGKPRRMSRRILGAPVDAVVARRVISASADRVLEVMEAVFSSDTYRLSLRERQGEPAGGGVLVFDILGASFTGTAASGFAAEASWADFRQVYASLRAVPGDRPATELTVRAPVAWAFTLNATVVGSAGVVGSGIGYGLGFAAGSVLAAAGSALALGPIVAVVAGLVAAGGAAGGGLGAVAALRAVYRHSLRRGERGLQGLLAAVATRAEGGWKLTGPSTS